MSKTPAPKTNVLHLLAASPTTTALAAVENLLKTGQKEVNELEQENLTALHVAAAWDNLAMCQLLMFFGADPFQEDDNGRTAVDMAKGSTKKFFTRLYETESSDHGKSRRQSFWLALRRFFSCTTLANKTPSHQKRRHSWSPVYNGKDNFLSEEEKRLRWAFRKNQPIGSNYEKKNSESIKLTGEDLSSSSYNDQKFIAAKGDVIKPDNSENDDSTAYTTAREHNTDIDNETFDECNISECSSDVLSRDMKSLKIGPQIVWPKEWMTEESTSDESHSIEISAEILAKVRQLSDQKLKQELARRGECIGPLIGSTRSAYQLKLARLLANIPTSVHLTKYSWALERWIAGHTFPEGVKLDEQVIDSFIGFTKQHWREGTRPTSFCYILIDPSLINRSNSCTMQQFVNAIFYIGKGKRSRPLQHLVDAVRAKDFGSAVLSKSKKLQKIVDLWSAGYGVVSLHVFQNTIPVEALTREAAMIDAIGLENLTNIKRGDYYGAAKNWTTKERTIYGSYLLFSALTVFRVEGCREIYENDIQRI